MLSVGLYRIWLSGSDLSHANSYLVQPNFSPSAFLLLLCWKTAYRVQEKKRKTGYCLKTPKRSPYNKNALAPFLPARGKGDICHVWRWTSRLSNAKTSLDGRFRVTDVRISGAMRTSGLILPVCVAHILTRQDTHSASRSLNRNGQLKDGHEKMSQISIQSQGPYCIIHWGGS